MKHVLFSVCETDIAKFYLRRAGRVRNGKHAGIRKLCLRKNVLDPVHTTVHDGEPRALPIEGL